MHVLERLQAQCEALSELLQGCRGLADAKMREILEAGGGWGRVKGWGVGGRGWWGRQVPRMLNYIR